MHASLFSLTFIHCKKPSAQKHFIIMIQLKRINRYGRNKHELMTGKKMNQWIKNARKNIFMKSTNNIVYSENHSNHNKTNRTGANTYKYT